MLWIQGKSTAWTYLSEMELNIHEEPAAAAAPVTRLVGDEIEQKAEEIRKRALNFKPRSVYIQQEPASEHTGYAGSYRLPGEEEIEFIDHRKKDNRLLNEVVMTSVIICLFAGGLYFGSSFLKSGREIISPAATEIATETEIRSTTRPAVAAAEPKQDHSVAEDSSFLQHQTMVQTENQIRTSNAPTRKQDTTTKISQPTPASTIALETKELKADPPALKTEEVIPVKKETEPVVAKKSTAINKEETPVKKQDTVVTEEEEKKGLGKAISRLFKKKKNKDDQKED